MEATDTPRRLRAADVIDGYREIIDQLTTRAPSEPSASVEITRNAAGNAQFTIKSYAPANASAEDCAAAMERAYDQATDAYNSLNETYPHVGKDSK